MTQQDLIALVNRLAHYAFAYQPGPRWNEAEAANKSQQAHLDGLEIERLAREDKLTLRKENDF
ncbi:MAG: hypothetical protein H8D67_30970 [Deltaproteobacteria bacterium]|nr:hypothetical protein [Deltaproteobacteria bacterium]